MSDKPKFRKAGNAPAATDCDERMALADAIMREDCEVLRSLAQMPVAREVMSRRRRALRDLAK